MWVLRGRGERLTFVVELLEVVDFVLIFVIAVMAWTRLSFKRCS